MGRRERAIRRQSALLRDLAEARTVRERRDARRAVRAAITYDSSTLPLRMALAEDYRAMHKEGAQAARWGIATPGWASDDEIAQLRRWLLGEYGPGDYVRRLLMLAPTSALPEAVADLVPESARGPQPPRRADGGCLFVFVAVVAALLGLVTTFLALLDLAGSGATPAESVGTRVATAAVSGWVALAAALVSALWFRRDQRESDLVVRRTSFTPEQEAVLAERLRASEPHAAQAFERAHAALTIKRAAQPAGSSRDDRTLERLLWGAFAVLCIAVAVAVAGALGAVWAIAAARIVMTVVLSVAIVAGVAGIVREAREYAPDRWLARVTSYLVAAFLVVVGSYLAWNYPIQGNWG